jgi:hypothetical protein
MPHTPGPWIADPDEDQRECATTTRTIRGADNNAIAWVYKTPGHDDASEEARSIGKCNLRLIRKAPEMFFYLRLLYPDLLFLKADHLSVRKPDEVVKQIYEIVHYIENGVPSFEPIEETDPVISILREANGL